jgi:hypothetical protein
MWKDRCLILLVLLAGLAGPSAALNIVLAGGTGEVARALVPRLVDHQVSLLARNAFLAAAPNRVTGEFGWVGASFLERYPHATLRDCKSLPKEHSLRPCPVGISPLTNPNLLRRGRGRPP